jgi:hypothetical protein
MKNWNRLMVAIGLLVICGLAISADVKPVYGFKGGVKVKPDRDVSKDDLKPIPAEGKFFSQAWTFVYYLDDGAGGYIQFSHARMGYALSNILVHHSHYSADGRLTYRKDVLSLKEMKYEESEPRLNMGKSFWSGFYPEFRVYAPLPGLETDLTFHSLTPPWRPGNGPVHYGAPDGDWYDLVVPIPLARVSGTIRVDGKNTKVSGFGYCDHNTQTVWFLSQVEELYALRSFGNGWAIHFLDYHSPKAFGGKRVSWLIVIKDGEIIYATDSYRIEPSDWTAEPKRGRKYPRQAKITIDGGGMKLTGEIKTTRLLDVLDVREETPDWAEPILFRLIREPAFMREKAEVIWTLNFEGREEIIPAQGIFEYTIVEKE